MGAIIRCICAVYSYLPSCTIAIDDPFPCWIVGGCPHHRRCKHPRHMGGVGWGAPPKNTLIIYLSGLFSTAFRFPAAGLHMIPGPARRPAPLKK